MALRRFGARSWSGAARVAGASRRRLQAVVLAGGLGTRLGRLAGSLPKSLYAVNGRPFLDYQLELLKRYGILRIVLCIGHLGGQIRDHFGDGSGLGLDIRYSEERSGLLGTAGAIRNAQDLLDDEFFLVYGDSYLPLDYGAVMDWFRQRGRLALMVVYRNRNRFDRSNVVIEGDFVRVYDKKGRTPGMEYINFGVSLLRKEALRLVPAGAPYSQEEWYRELVAQGELLAYETEGRFYEIGSPKGLEEFRRLAGVGVLP